MIVLGLYRLFVELPPHARRIPFSDWVSHSAKGTTSACAENTNGTR